MEATQKSSTALFDVYLRLRPPTAQPTDPFLEVDEAIEGPATHITIKPPLDDHRKRAIEKFAFTKVFSEDAAQLDIFNGTNILPMVEGVLGPDQKPGRDGLLATLGVTGSGKTHTILGSRTQRGLTQLTLDVLFKSIGSNIVQPTTVFQQLASVDVAESVIFPASAFLESIYGDGDSRAASRAQTPMPVSSSIRANISTQIPVPRPPPLAIYHALQRLNAARQEKPRVKDDEPMTPQKPIRPANSSARVTRSITKIKNPPIKEPQTPSRSIYSPAPSHKRHMPPISTLPRLPNVDDIHVASDQDAEYALVVSMYEVYNDRIFDLLTGTAMNTRFNGKEIRRRALLFKNTEWSADQKVVCGLRKVVCGSLDEALLVLETGLTERRVAGTGTNAVSSRSHGFFCVEVKKRNRSRSGTWRGSTLTIVDLAGSERARTAKTTGSTLAEAGKINESLMYLGQVMQMQSSSEEGRSLVPIRHCKLTELLFTNSFHNQGSAFAPSSLNPHNTRTRQQINNHHQNTPNAQAQHHPQQQKAIMIVTADPRGDFNATSQILRYSALAREVTVPRIPSVTSTIMSGAHSGGPSSRPQTANSSFTSEPGNTEELGRLTSEMAVLRLQLDEESRRRREAESSWMRAESRLEEVEAEVREECWAAFEERLRLERDRWASAWEEQRERNDGHLDSKLDIMVRGLDLGVYEDGTGAVPESAERVEELERENEILRDKVNGLERERTARTPSRKVKVLKARKWDVSGDGVMSAEDGDAENMSPF